MPTKNQHDPLDNESLDNTENEEFLLDEPLDEDTEVAASANVGKNVITLDFSVRRNLDSRRIDRYLSMRFATHSRTIIQKLIRQGAVTVNGHKVKPSYEVRKDDEVHVEFPVIEERWGKPEDIPIDVVYEDEHIMAINKQPGIVTHPAPGHSGGTLLNAILHHCGTIDDPDTDRPGIVHRLDKNTTGIMLFAKNAYSRSNLQQQFENRKIEKTYTAIAERDPEFDADLIDLPISTDIHHRQRMTIDTEGRSSQTIYEVLERFGDYTLVRCMPRTGRTHQIRVHLASIGHPIASDDLYGGITPVYPSTLESTAAHEEDEQPLIARHALHATTIAFRHPVTKEWLVLEAPFPDDFKRLLSYLRERGPVSSHPPHKRTLPRRTREK